MPHVDLEAAIVADDLTPSDAVRLGREMPAADLTRALAGAALARLSALSNAPARRA